MTLSTTKRATLWTDRTAVVDDGGTEHTYDAFAERAGRTADRLTARGVGDGDAVAVISRNRLEHLALLFACRRLGATLAPISHRLEVPAVESLGERIDPELVLHEDRFEELADATAAGASSTDAPRTATFGAFAETEPVAPDARPPTRGAGHADATDESPLLYLHTGGTTGVPKVVVVSHRQVEWNCITEVAAWGLGEDDVAPVLLPLYHTGGWLLLTLPLLYVGGQVVLQRTFDPGRALSAIEEYGATRVFAVAAVFGAMADHETFAETDCSTVKWFMSGGGPTPDHVIEAYRDRGLTFVQGYGLTEGGPNDLYFPPERADETKSTESVGRPFPDCEARLVDPEDGTVLGATTDATATPEAGEGVTGELELRGPVTARRYLDTEDGTFDGDPASEASGTTENRRFSGEWVSTDDLATRDADGDYVIVGRTDNMFVSGGENVYPEAIEDALERHPAVATAGVVGIPHGRWGTVPKAVVVPAAGDGGSDGASAIDLDDLEAFARDRLADFEVPHAWVRADGLPRSGPGKLDRAVLAREFGDRTADDAGRTAETNGDDVTGGDAS